MKPFKIILPIALLLITLTASISLLTKSKPPHTSKAIQTVSKQIEAKEEAFKAAIQTTNTSIIRARVKRQDIQAKVRASETLENCEILEALDSYEEATNLFLIERQESLDLIALQNTKIDLLEDALASEQKKVKVYKGIAIGSVILLIALL